MAAPYGLQSAWNPKLIARNMAEERAIKRRLAAVLHELPPCSPMIARPSELSALSAAVIPAQRVGKDVAEGLLWGSDGTMSPLRPWAQWLRQVGTVAARHNVPRERLNILVTVPTRRMAAVLVLVGVAEALCERNPDPTAHWKMLRELPAGTVVRRLDGGFYVCSRIRGVELRSGVEYLDLGGVRRRWDRCLDVQPLPPGEEEFAWRRAASDEPLLDAVLRGVDARTYCSSSVTLSTVVGSKKAIGEELGSTCLGMGNGAPTVTASQVVRPRLQSGFPYRSDLLAATAEDLPKRAERGSPVAVLDGPAAILRWRHRVRSRTTVMVLDRSAPSADAAVGAVIADRARSLRDSGELIPPAPAGIEVLAYVGRG